jgi:hypothetical protein
MITRKAAVICVSSSVVLLLVLLFVATSSSPPSCRVKGRVVDRWTGQPVEATVEYETYWGTRSMGKISSAAYDGFFDLESYGDSFVIRISVGGNLVMTIDSSIVDEYYYSVEKHYSKGIFSPARWEYDLGTIEI